MLLVSIFWWGYATDCNIYEALDNAFVPQNPTDAWLLMRNKLYYESFNLLNNTYSPPKEDVLRVVCISDTHDKHTKIDPASVPAGDVLVHAGDITLNGNPESFRTFKDWIGKLPHKHKLVIGGNHDLTLDPGKFAREAKEEAKIEARRHVIDVDEFSYLQDDAVEIEGYRFYGSPTQPSFYEWAFQRVSNSELDILALIMVTLVISGSRPTD